MIKRKQILLVFTLILSITMLYSCKRRKAKMITNAQKIYTAVEVVKVSSSAVKERVFATGDIRGIEEVKLFSFVTGVLKRKFVAEGQFVRRGQALFAVDQTVRGLDILDHIVRSPIDGVVSDIQPDLGEQIIANQSVIGRVVKSHLLKVSVSVGVSNIRKIKLHNIALIKVEAYPNKVFTGKVIKISPTVDLESRTSKVDILINSYNRKLKSGMFADVAIISNTSQNRIMVPQECVIFDDNTNYVFKLDPTKKKALKQIVKIGPNYSGQIIIQEGINTGDFIINKGQYNVFHGFNVKVINNNTIARTN